jgi:exodeoxyribonuclease-5
VVVTLSDEQNQAVEGVLAAIRQRQVVTVGGYAGTGKSVLAGELVRRTGYAAAAFTNKAASVLRSRGMSEASTIHRLIYEIVTDEDGKPVLVDGALQFRRRKFLPVAGVIIDEASMVPLPLHEDLKSFGVPLIYIGDHGQLPPVGNDAKLMAFPEFRLETIHRNAGEIARFAEWIRTGNSAADWVGISDAVEVLTDWTEADLERIATVDQMLCAYNATRVKQNAMARSLRRQAEGRRAVDRLIDPGEKLIVTNNDYRNELYNGQIVRARHSWRDGYRFKAEIIPDDGPDAPERVLVVEYDPNSINNTSRTSGRVYGLTRLDYGYCITCHKAQGSEYGSLAVIEEVSGMWEHARWAYTAASRAKQKLFWYAQKQPSKRI